MSSFNKSTSINVSDIPHFTGCNFQAWKDKMVSIFMITKVHDVVKGDTTKPDESKRPKMPSTPPVITGEMSNADTEKAARYWTQFNVQMNYYNAQLADFNRKMSTWTNGNSQAMGIFNRALDIGIWDQVKDMTAAATGRG